MKAEAASAAAARAVRKIRVELPTTSVLPGDHLHRVALHERNAQPARAETTASIARAGRSVGGPTPLGWSEKRHVSIGAHTEPEEDQRRADPEDPPTEFPLRVSRIGDAQNHAAEEEWNPGGDSKDEPCATRDRNPFESQWGRLSAGPIQAEGLPMKQDVREREEPPASASNIASGKPQLQHDISSR